MIFLFNLALTLLVISLFLFIHPTKEDAIRFQELFQKKDTFKNITSPKQSRIAIYNQKIQNMLKATGRANKFYTYFFASLILGCAGIFMGLYLQNGFLVPVLAVFGIYAPFLKLRLDYIKYQRLVIEELDTTLRAISISYERCENILQAIEENLPYMRMPVKKPFEEFVVRIKTIDPNLDQGIEDLKTKIDHSVFLEWCDALIRCSHNRNLKFSLNPIVDKLTEIKIVLGETKNILYISLHNYYVMLVLITILIGIALFVLPGLLQTQIPAIIRHALIALNVACIGFTSYKITLEMKNINTDF